jgi:hypothetical protein
LKNYVCVNLTALALLQQGRNNAPVLLSSNFGFSKRVMLMSVLVSDCPPDLEKPKLDDNSYKNPSMQSCGKAATA